MNDQVRLTRRISVDPRVDAHSPTPICWPGAGPLANVIEGSGLLRDPARPREYGIGITPNAVTRAIEDLTRSGYRPLHARLATPEP